MSNQNGPQAPRETALLPDISRVTAEFIDLRDKRWLAMLKEVDHDFYHLPEYVNIEAQQAERKPVAFYAECGSSRFLVPLMLSKLPPHLNAPDDWCDATTPYGYPSPLLLSDGDAENAERDLRIFLRAFGEAGATQNVVTAFLRQHPLLPLPSAPLEEFGQLVRHGQTVYFDLRASEGAAREQLCSNHRRDLKKLRAAGFKVTIDDWSFFPQFVEVYRANMKRLDAAQMYYFEGDYFSKLRNVMGGSIHLGVIEAPNGDVAAAGLFIKCCDIVQYHLGGAADAYFRVSPVKLLVDEMRRWSKEQNARFLHLGGGLGGNEDSLFHFKAGFSRERADFFTYRMILDESKYRHLIEAWQKNGGQLEEESSFFPLYRRSA